MNPGALHRLPLLSPKAGQRQETDNRKSGHILAIALGIGHSLSQRDDLGRAQSPGFLVCRELFGTTRRMLCQQPLVLGMTEDRLKRSKAARSEERRVGKECASTGRYRGAPYN